jgi:hypothetical protein
MPPAVLVDLGFTLSFLARLSIAATVRLSCREISAGLAPDAVSLSSCVSWSDVHGGLAINRREVSPKLYKLADLSLNALYQESAYKQRSLET